jgi:hypothetical protein
MWTRSQNGGTWTAWVEKANSRQLRSVTLGAASETYTIPRDVGFIFKDGGGSNNIPMLTLNGSNLDAGDIITVSLSNDLTIRLDIKYNNFLNLDNIVRLDYGIFKTIHLRYIGDNKFFEVSRLNSF